MTWRWSFPRASRRCRAESRHDSTNDMEVLSSVLLLYIHLLIVCVYGYTKYCFLWLQRYPTNLIMASQHVVLRYRRIILVVAFHNWASPKRCCFETFAAADRAWSFFFLTTSVRYYWHYHRPPNGPQIIALDSAAPAMCMKCHINYVYVTLQKGSGHYFGFDKLSARCRLIVNATLIPQR